MTTLRDTLSVEMYITFLFLYCESNSAELKA